MFDSLDEQIKADEHRATSSRERAIRILLYVVVSVLVFGGIFLGLHMMQGT